MRPTGPSRGPAPTRRRGLAFMAAGTLYGGAMVPLSIWSGAGWVRWGVLVSGLAAGGMLVALGVYVFRIAADPRA